MPTATREPPGTYRDIWDEGCCKRARALTSLKCGVDYRVHGHLESFKYFLASKDELLDQFKFGHRTRERCDAIIHSVIRSAKNETGASNCVIIGGHFRRGDFTNPQLMDYGHSPARASYMHAAIHYFRKKLGSENKCLRFLIIGNDHKWNLANAPKAKDVTVLDKNSASVDLCLLASSNHSIVSTGTFGWWGAFLAGGQATVQKEYALPGSQHEREFDTRDYWLPHWKPL